MLRKLLPSIFIIALLVTSCKEGESEGGSLSNYFDLEAFINNLGEENNKQSIIKTVSLNEVSEEKTLKNYNIIPELTLMKKYNINKASLSGKYGVEERKDGQEVITVYKALEEGLKTRELMVRKLGKEVVKIEITGLQKSLLSEIQQKIIYEPQSLFSMTATDNNRFSKDLKKEILIKF